MSNNNKVVIVSSILALVILAGSIFLSLHTTQTNDANSQPSTSLNPRPTPAKSYPDTKTWSIYLNYKLGIAFKFPQYTLTGKILFVQAGNILFLTNSSSPIFIHKHELAKLKNEAEIIQAAQKLTSDKFLPWMIRTREIHSNADLEHLIQDKFGDQKCRLGDLRDSSQDYVYDVGVAPVDPGTDGLSSSSCWINWNMDFKYSPKLKLASIWDVGQEDNFHTDSCPGIPGCSIDRAIADSFFFIEPDAEGNAYIDSVLQEK
jgi:hypothetical protein